MNYHQIKLLLLEDKNTEVIEQIDVITGNIEDFRPIKITNYKIYKDIIHL